MTDQKINVAIDIGSSLGKCCYRVETYPPPPEPGQGFPPGQNKTEYGWLHQANAVDVIKHRDLAKDSCTIEIRGKEWTVGRTAQYTMHETHARGAKSNTAGLRVLGMLGKVIELEKLTEGDLYLEILLPAGERQYFQKLEDHITKALYEVVLNGIKPSLTLKRVRVYPEGTGVARSVSVKDAVVLMFGHKDISILPVFDQIIQTEACQTLTGMGMIALIKQFPCVNNDELLKAEFLHRQAVGKKGLANLLELEIKRGDVDLAQSVRDFAKAKDVVWQRIQQKLNLEPKLSTAPKVYVTGGSMRVWEKELKQFFGKRVTYFIDPLKSMIQTFPDFQEPDNKELLPRFTDSFMLLQGGSNG